MRMVFPRGTAGFNPAERCINWNDKCAKCETQVPPEKDKQVALCCCNHSPSTLCGELQIYLTWTYLPCGKMFILVAALFHRFSSYLWWIMFVCSWKKHLLKYLCFLLNTSYTFLTMSLCCSKGITRDAPGLAGAERSLGLKLWLCEVDPPEVLQVSDRPSHVSLYLNNNWNVGCPQLKTRNMQCQRLYSPKANLNWTKIFPTPKLNVPSCVLCC